MSVHRTEEATTPPTNRRPSAARQRPEFGTGRIGVISSYFQLSGIAAATAAIPMAVATFFPRMIPSLSSRPIVPLIACTLLAFGYFRTSRLLDRRRRSGAQLAALCFVASLAGLFTNGADWMVRLTAVVSVAGLAMVASVWKYLERD